MAQKFTVKQQSSTHKWIKYLSVVVLTILLLICFYGQLNFHLTTQDDNTYVILQQENKKLKELNKSLVDNNAELQTSVAVDKKTYKITQQQITKQKKEIVELENELSFYKKLLDSSTKDKNKIFLKSFSLNKIDPKTYRFSIFLAKTYDGRFAQGGVEFSVVGLKKDKETTLNNKDLDIKKVGFNFKVVQEIEGNLYLPDDFKADKLDLKIKPRYNRYENVTKEYDWTQLTNNQ
jgi:cell division protein FtsB